MPRGEEFLEGHFLDARKGTAWEKKPEE